ncbi:hypothetical protein KH5H1_44650 [Corallococcus caeni]|uniref:GNAT family N-acetyltransferase n=1 Tax=Corallococcus caeni TaxID=3082388 RepID=UPI0029561646|nr:hypothetical protein KH5H1_44650 [Corallococcus sp. KH5-1]
MTASLVFPELTAITSRDAASGFRCEEEALSRYFQQQATQQGRREENRTWVIHRPDGRPDLPSVLGFYTLTWIQLERSSLPEPVTRRLPDYPIRAILIGRLARDERCKGMGIGEHLLDDAHRRALRVNAEIGGLVVVVDAKNARAAAFYEAHDYTVLIRAGSATIAWPQRYFVKMEDLRATYAGT